MDQGRSRLLPVLVAAALVIIVAAVIVYPVFAPPRPKAGQPSCRQNVKNLTLGFRMYAEDNAGHLPPDMHRWPIALYPYVKTGEFFSCPQDLRNPVGVPDKAEASYALNPSAMGLLDRGASDLPLLFDANALVGTQAVAAYRHPQKRWGFTHEGLNVGFCDGHVAWVERGEFEKMDMAP